MLGSVGVIVAHGMGVEVIFGTGFGVGVGVGVEVGVVVVVGVGVINEPPVAVTVSAFVHALEDKFMCIHGRTTFPAPFIYSLE